MHPANTPRENCAVSRACIPMAGQKFLVKGIATTGIK